MIFPYHGARRGSETRQLPLVPVVLHGPHESVDIVSLVDSGAEHNIFRLDVAENLGLELDYKRKVTLLGYDGRPRVGYLVTVELGLGRHRWTAPAIFSEFVTRRGLLGQVGFFAFFTVTFRYRKREMDIRWAK